jgi:lysophospholipase L1-like esterase
MMKLLFFALLFPAGLFGQLQLLQGPIRLLALGDSYTIGQSVSSSARWPVQLGDSLAILGYEIDTVRIIATTGWRTDNLINAVKGKNLEDLNYNLVSLLIGVNNQYQGRPFIQYAGEFPALLDSAIRYAGGDRSKVFVVSIPDYAYTPFGQQSNDPAGISMQIDAYNEYNRRIADSMHVAYFDITPISRQGLNQPSYVANDGLHPSALQYTQWVKLMLSSIDLLISGASPADMDFLPDVTVRPNLSSGHFILTIPEAYVKLSCMLEVCDLSGNILQEYPVSQPETTVSIEDLPDACYLLRVSCQHRHTTLKVIKLSN